MIKNCVDMFFGVEVSIQAQVGHCDLHYTFDWLKFISNELTVNCKNKNHLNFYKDAYLIVDHYDLDFMLYWPMLSWLEVVTFREDT